MTTGRLWALRIESKATDMATDMATDTVCDIGPVHKGHC